MSPNPAVSRRRGRRTGTVLGLTAVAMVLGAVPALAQDADALEEITYAIDTVWIALCAALVLLMHLGFGMLEAGLTRAKNAANIVGKNMITIAIGAVAYWAIGGALAYGDDVGGVIGTTGFFDPSAVLGDGTQAIFQLVFAATAATIVSGAVAERINFYAYAIIAVSLTAVIFPIISHWQWYGEGAWLADLGFYDFAGSGLVHMTGGVSALVAVAILGPRIGKYGRDGRPRAIPGHSIPLAIFGVIVLFFGWFGFNGGSTLSAVGNGEAIGVILLNTTIAGGAGALAAWAANVATSGKPDPAMIGNGALAGLVGITAGPDLANNVEAFVVGAIAGGIVVLAVSFFDRVKMDDPVGAISVHGVCGAFGVLAVGVYGVGDVEGTDISIVTQAIGVLAIAAFAAVTVGLVAFALKAAGILRVSEQEEVDGLDIHEHGVAGYSEALLGGGAAPATDRQLRIPEGSTSPATAEG